jgi:hypothetical protein
VNLLLCEAIRRRRLLMFEYGDRMRVVEPHLYGVNTAGREALSAWLRPGHSRADPDGGWRMYLVEGMHAVQLLPDAFDAPREGFNPDDPHLPEVFCRLAPPGDDAPAGDAPS